jgi:hypothetical protein
MSCAGKGWRGASLLIGRVPLLLDKRLDTGRLILALGQIARRLDRNLQQASLLQKLALLDRKRAFGHLASPLASGRGSA